jgi:putative endonuclease
MHPCVYILASRRNGTLSIGLATDLVRRVHQHREKQLGGFTAKDNGTRLVHFEPCLTLEAARIREKRLKGWRRAWKIALIEERNPDWIDLWPGLVSGDAAGQGPG